MLCYNSPSQVFITKLSILKEAIAFQAFVFSLSVICYFACCFCYHDGPLIYL